MINKTAIIPLNLTLLVPEFPGGKWDLTLTLISSGKELILVDTGMPNVYSDIKIQMKNLGFPIEKLTGIVLTHQDINHIGSLSDLLEKIPSIKVYAHKEDKDYITGKHTLIKGLPAMLHSFAEGFSTMENRIDCLLEDGTKLKNAGGMIVIHTPGHTPGHISLYYPQTKTLIAGDAMVIRGGKLMGPNEMNTPNIRMAYHSLIKLTNFDIQKVICYHGGVYEQDVNKQIIKITKTYFTD
ncbi:MBL fold metallo-hydrolase [Bacillus cereus]|uniref:MBL fold metallo-hydrolase n=1 Tax=Bacillus cereus TaxID=1396 RepID=A0A2B2LBX7_BACCE|nr:MBL fold metallo-hydrolase [Bacillus cereus]PFQ40488.1 MBL fold metallo-hydrolase [Bacillus cereus]PGU13277.1 MBL fold metallo-hydrolase [Bacillus cereus]